MPKARRGEQTRTIARQRKRETLWSSLVLVVHRRPLHPGCALGGLAVMALVMLAGFHNLLVSWLLVRGGVSTTGTVISYQEASSPSCKGGDFSHILFVTSEKRQIDLEKTEVSCSQTYRVGEQVPVLYNPSDPHQAEIASFSELWGWPVAAVLFGALGCLVFWLATAASVKRALQRNERKERSRDQSL